MTLRCFNLRQLLRVFSYDTFVPVRLKIMMYSQNENPFCSYQKDYEKKPKKLNTAIDVEKLQPLNFSGGNVVWYIHFGNNMVVTQKVQYMFTVLSDNFTPSFPLKRTENISTQKVNIFLLQQIP